MAQTNYLNIYRILISKRGSSEKTKFRDLYKYFDPNGHPNYDDAFKKISLEYYTSFNGQYVKSANEKRALTAQAEGSIKFKSEKRIIHGLVNGGITDVEFKSYKGDDNQNPIGKITTDMVLVQDYYFAIWMPRGSNVGYVFLQTNDSVNRGINAAFFDHLGEFFNKFGFNLTKSPYVPQKIAKEFIDDSEIVEIEYIQVKPDDRFSVKGEVKKIRVVHSIKGLALPLGWFKGATKARQEIRSFLNLVSQDDEGDINVIYKKDGQKRKGTLDDIGGIIPKITIDESYLNGKDNVDKIEKMFNFVEEHINLINSETAPSKNVNVD